MPTSLAHPPPPLPTYCSVILCCAHAYHLLSHHLHHQHDNDGNNDHHYSYHSHKKSLLLHMISIKPQSSNQSCEIWYVEGRTGLLALCLPPSANYAFILPNTPHFVLWTHIHVTFIFPPLQRIAIPVHFLLQYIYHFSIFSLLWKTNLAIYIFVGEFQFWKMCWCRFDKYNFFLQRPC